jgi:5-methylcytosine-specific restriction endonuclease McrA
MTTYIPASLRQLVSQRASGSCEYCSIHQTFSMYSHEVDHVIALKHGGESTEDNLVIACLVVQRSPEKGTEEGRGLIKRKGAKAWLDSFSKKQNHLKKWLRPNYIVNY